MTFPDPQDFPDYDPIDSRTVIDPEDSFSEDDADFESEPEHSESE